MGLEQERRDAPRIFVRGEAILDTDEGQLLCPVLDISSTGLGVLGPAELAPGTIVRVTFLDEGPLAELEFSAEVVRVTERNQIRTLGLRFSPEDLAAASLAVNRARSDDRRVTQLRPRA